MEEKKFEFVQLANNWRALSQEIKKNKLNFEMFSDTFLKTYQVLKQQDMESCIDKKFLSLIISASLFAHADVSHNLESKYKAALVLTERMIDAVTAANKVSLCDETVVYILELRQEIIIDFSNVNDSIEALTKVFEADYWNKLNQ